MKGLYYNVAKITDICDEFKFCVNRDAEIVSEGKVNLIVSANRQSSQLVDENGDTLVVYGWVTYNNKMNPLEEILNDFREILKNEEPFGKLKFDSGNFIIYLLIKETEYIVTDPWGFAAHYARFDNKKIDQIAPSPAFIKEGASVNKLCESILNKKNHLFGDLTLYNEILRLSPGFVYEIDKEKKSCYFNYANNTKNSLEDAMDAFSANYGFGNNKERSILPISGGLDSRFILGVHEFSYGYTFGPRDTGDRPVARNFREYFDYYDEFSFKELTYEQKVKDYSSIIFDGISQKPFAELLVVYRKLKNCFPEADFFYDGYLGDVLLRGTYFNHTSFKGNFQKIFVSSIYKNFTPEKVLKQRYAQLSSEEFSLLLHQYNSLDVIQNLAIPDTHKFLLFEMLYGRGARYIVNGGTTMASQFYTVVQPFFQNKSMFDYLFQQSAKEMLNWAKVKAVFKCLPKSLSIKTYSGYSPLWPAFVNRPVMLGNKTLSKLGIIKGSQSYDDELKDVEWRKMKD